MPIQTLIIPPGLLLRKTIISQLELGPPVVLLAYLNGVMLEYDNLSRLRIALTRMQNSLWETGFAFCFDICRIIDQCSPNCSKKWNEKINCWIHVVQICLKLAGVCNETVYIPVRKHWSWRRLQWIKQNTIHILKNYIFLLILTEDDRGRFEVSKKSSLAMQTLNWLLSGT